MASDANSSGLTYRPSSLTAGFLSYLVPGLGQIYQGRTAKGVLFLVCLYALFFTGNALGHWRNVYLPDPADFPQTRINLPILQERELNGVFKAIFWRWQFLGQFWIGIAAWPAIWQFNELPVPSEQTNAFIHNLQRFPRDEGKLNEELTNSDKTPDVAWVYTVIAGVLNILVIYDAYAGPAYLLSDQDQKPKPEEAVA